MQNFSKNVIGNRIVKGIQNKIFNAIRQSKETVPYTIPKDIGKIEKINTARDIAPIEVKVYESQNQPTIERNPTLFRDSSFRVNPPVYEPAPLLELPKPSKFNLRYNNKPKGIVQEEVFKLSDTAKPFAMSQISKAISNAELSHKILDDGLPQKPPSRLAFSPEPKRDNVRYDLAQNNKSSYIEKSNYR